MRDGYLQKVRNLNDLTINDDRCHSPRRDENDCCQKLDDCSSVSADGQVRVYFKDIERRLLTHIQAADIVVGSVAWLTSPAILKALAKKTGVSIIVQKEDFLRPDCRSQSNFGAKLRQLYSLLPGTLSRYDESIPSPLQGMSYNGDLSIDAVRCIGNHNSDRSPAFPRAHNKFVVFCKRMTLEQLAAENGMTLEQLAAEKGMTVEQYTTDTRLYYMPYGVWTGSYNFTQTAARSFENALYIVDPVIVGAYFLEYAQLAALSEPLNWESPWVAPEWRIGT